MLIEAEERKKLLGQIILPPASHKRLPSFKARAILHA